MDVIKGILQIIFLVPAIAVFAIYAAKSVMMESARKWIDRRNSWIGYAIKCAFCLCGWASLVLTIGYRPLLMQYLFDASFTIFGWNIFWLVNFLSSWFALWGLSTLCYKHLWLFLEKNAPKMRIKWSGRRKLEDDYPNSPPIL